MGNSGICAGKRGATVKRREEDEGQDEEGDQKDIPCHRAPTFRRATATRGRSAPVRCPLSPQTPDSSVRVPRCAVGVRVKGVSVRTVCIRWTVCIRCCLSHPLSVSSPKSINVSSTARHEPQLLSELSHSCSSSHTTQARHTDAHTQRASTPDREP